MQISASYLAVRTIAAKLYGVKFAYIKNLCPSSEDLPSPQKNKLMTKRPVNVMEQRSDRSSTIMLVYRPTNHTNKPLLNSDIWIPFPRLHYLSIVL
jgi:hypothetical protein